MTVWHLSWGREKVVVARIMRGSRRGMERGMAGTGRRGMERGKAGTEDTFSTSHFPCGAR